MKTEKLTTVQQTIMWLLEKHDFVRVHGGYAGDVLSLEVQGLVTQKMSGGKFEVRAKAGGERQAAEAMWYAELDRVARERRKAEGSPI